MSSTPTNPEAKQSVLPAADVPARAGSTVGTPPIQSAATTGTPPVVAAPPVQQPATSFPATGEVERPLWLDLLRNSPSWIVSMIVHTVLLLTLALWALPAEEKVHVNDLVVVPNAPENPIEEALEVLPIDAADVQQFDVKDFQSATSSDDVLYSSLPSVAQDMDAAQEVVAVEVQADGQPLNAGMLTQVGGLHGTGMTGRGMASRGALVRQGGGTEASEQAVALALKWLAEHQLPDGSWNFDQRRCPNCRGKCKDQGEFAEMTNAATALALLPFLGAGQTHQAGNYKKNVKAGLAYLERKMRKSRFRHRGYGSVTHGDLTDPGQGMYSHGLAAIALSEAYGMTQDQRLLDTAQLAVNFCITGQDRSTGGWGYTHGSGNDSSVAGWQIMALKSARMAYLDVPDAAFKKAYRFLDSVQADGGSHYGYRSPGTGPATSAVGLLCRMYMGWQHDNPALERGVLALAELGPAQNNMYFNYYATQVLFQYTSGTGPVWEKWNNTLRDFLIQEQVQAGHETGSWNECTYVLQGGRLYATCLSAMCLEVYYRHMPIYQEQAASGEQEFRLD